MATMAQAVRLVLTLGEAKLDSDEDTQARIASAMAPRDVQLALAAALSLLADDLHLVGHLTGQDPKRLLADLRTEMRRRFTAVGVAWPDGTP